LKNVFFSRPSRPISIKFGINHLWAKSIQVYSNIGSGPLQRGEKYKNVKVR
jgi:hypothetical protein